MALSKPEKKKEKLALTIKALIDWSTPESGCKKLLSDIEDYGLKVEEGISVNSIRSVHMLLSKKRVTERAFAIYSINFSQENSFEWTSNSEPQTIPHPMPETTFKKYLHQKSNSLTRRNARPTNNLLRVNLGQYRIITVLTVDSFQ